MNASTAMTLLTIVIIVVLTLTVVIFYLGVKNKKLRSTIVLQQRVFRQELSASTPPKLVKPLPKRKQSFKEWLISCFQ